MSKMTMIIKTTTQDGKRDEVFAAYRELLAPRAEANDQQEVVVWCNDAQDPNTFYLFEIYASQEAFQAQAGAEWFAQYMAKVGPLLAGEPTISFGTPAWATGLAQGL